MECPPIAPDQRDLCHFQKPPARTAAIIDTLDRKGNLRWQSGTSSRIEQTASFTLIAFGAKPVLLRSVAELPDGTIGRAALA
jgi:hypothetical protein